MYIVSVLQEGEQCFDEIICQNRAFYYLNNKKYMANSSDIFENKQLYNDINDKKIPLLCSNNHYLNIDFNGKCMKFIHSIYDETLILGIYDQNKFKEINNELKTGTKQKEQKINKDTIKTISWLNEEKKIDKNDFDKLIDTTFEQDTRLTWIKCQKNKPNNVVHLFKNGKDYDYRYKFSTFENKQIIYDIERLKRSVSDKYRFLCENNHEIIPCFKYNNEKAIKLFFKHKKINIHFSELSDWHINWQNEFDKKYQEIIIKNYNFSTNSNERRADVYINDIVIEFQYSTISNLDIGLRSRDYIDILGKKLFWVVYIDPLHISLNSYKYETKIKCLEKSWMFKNFDINIPKFFIFLNIGDKLYKIDPKTIDKDTHSITISNENICTRKQFVNVIKNYNKSEISTNLIDKLPEDEKLNLPTIWYNQRGAGCGKTFESIQLLSLTNKNYANKTLFVYLTKVHSAKSVINKELNDQINSEKLILTNFNQINEEKSNKFIYTFEHDGEVKTIIIATIDSFLYAFGSKKHELGINKKYYDMFKNIRHSIIESGENVTRNKDGRKVKYVGKGVNNEGLIIIDEAQDLNDHYCKSILTIVKATKADCYIIGDLLQSIWDDVNLMTELPKMCKPDHFLHKYYNHIKLVINKQTPCVRRFHNSELMDWNNNYFKNVFPLYGLPAINSICPDEGKCGINHNLGTYHVELIDIEDDKYMDSLQKIKHIIPIVAKEVEENKWEPKDFMFIFPIMKCNTFAENLETKLKKFWHDQDEKYDDPVYLHRSTNGEPINLEKSENKTRILSIHSSKGNGAPVVFVLGVNNHSLAKFNGSTLVKNSLIYVATTRAKCSMYIYDKKSDNIFNKGVTEDIKTSDKDFISISKYIHTNHISNNLIENIDNNDKNFITQNNLINKLVKRMKNSSKDDTKIDSGVTEWGDHITRIGFSNYYINKYIIERIKKDTKNGVKNFSYYQQLKNLCDPKQTSIQIFEEVDEYLKFKDNNYKIPRTIPLTTFKNNISKIQLECIQAIMIEIINKIRKFVEDTMNELPKLCPYECIILHYMSTSSNISMDYKNRIQISEIYRITNDYIQYYSDKNIRPNCLCAPLLCGKSSYTTNKSLSNFHNKARNLQKQIKKIEVDPTSRYTCNAYQPLTYIPYIVDQLAVEYEKDFKFIKLISQNTKAIITNSTTIQMVYFTQNYTNINKKQLNLLFILDYFMLYNHKKTNGELDPTKKAKPKYINEKTGKLKNVEFIILTLNSYKPIIIKLNLTEDDIDLIRDIIIKPYIIKYFEPFYSSIYELCCFVNNNVRKPKEKLKSCIKKYLVWYSCSHNNFMDKCPKSIRYFLENQIKIDYIKTKEEFIKHISEYINDQIDDFLEIPE